MITKIFYLKELLVNRNELIEIAKDTGIDADDIQRQNMAVSVILSFLNRLREDLLVIEETDYVDRVFRDCYYGYYASKHVAVRRDCVRLSFIEPSIDVSKIFNNDQLDKLNSCYKGFVTLRPIHNIIGRNVISPDALKDHGCTLSVCRANIPASCIGIKTYAEGFPHSRQDGEVMSCAETTVWGLMEYFGVKYPEYKTVLPSDIHNIINPMSYERHIPSNGLTFSQIAKVIQHCGFGAKIYSCDNSSFQEILACYMESGIPVAVCLESDKIGHAVMCIGHEKLDRSQIDKCPTSYILGKELVVWNRCIENFVFNDDNFPPYQLANFSNPTSYYHDAKWDNVKATIIVVPLNKKIYLEAEDAICLSEFIAVNFIKIRAKSVIRTFLASTRTYKEYLMKNPDIKPDQKEIYLNLEMPKFVWVTEISDIDTCKNNKINGFVIIDATNPKKSLESIIFSQYDGSKYELNRKSGMVEKVLLPLPNEIESFRFNLN